MSRVVIVGSGGQDGRLLFDERAREAAVVGLDVGRVVQHGMGARAPDAPIDVADRDAVARLVERVVPDEVYYLAAHHHSSEERPDEATELRRGYDVHVTGLVNVLEGIRTHAPHCRLFYAGSSQMFGWPTSSPQDETTPFSPRTPYAITKVAGAHACALYRERHGVHASVGILYNHESPLRGPRFVTSRIARGARQAAGNPSYKLSVGSLSAIVDWGYAPDYIDAMARIMSQPTPDDYVVATGIAHTVQEFVEVAFRHVGLDWKDHVQEDSRLVGGSSRHAPIIGNASLLRRRTGWRPTTTFESIVTRMVDAAS